MNELILGGLLGFLLAALLRDSLLLFGLRSLLLLSLWWRRGEVAAGQVHGGLTIPWFAFGFIAVVVIHSIWPLSQALHQKMLLLDSLMLSAAMAGLGLETRFDRLRVLGLKPLMFAAVLFLVLVLGGGLLSRYLLLSV